MATNGAGASVSGGHQNTAYAAWSAVCGGYLNTANSSRTTVCGGENNVAQGGTSTISGGQNNFTASSARYATISGGCNVTIDEMCEHQ